MINSTNVTVILPIFNEERHIAKSLEYIINQDWEGHIEIIVVDGNSTDNSVNIIRDIAKRLPSNRSLKILSNPKRHIPVSLNIACKNASNDIIVRIDGHTFAPINYVSESVNALKSINYNGIVGGRCIISKSDDTKIADAIAISASNPFGVGNALYRTFDAEDMSYIEVDTVPFGAFTKKVWENLGGYDELLLFDEDYDYNYRALKHGYKIVMNPKIALNYFSRKNLKLLWKQYFNYGFWANKFCLKHKVIPSIRRLVPMTFVLSLPVSLIFYMPAFYAILAIYLLTMLVVSLYEGMIKRKDLTLGFFMMAVFLTLHFSYGIGGWSSLIASVFKLPKKQ